MNKALVSWIGQTDLNAALRNESGNPGPVAGALSERSFDRAVLLCNYPEERLKEFLSWLVGRCGEDVRIDSRSVSLSNPTDYTEIYEAVIPVLRELKGKPDSDTDLTFHLSPGTPTMTAILVLLGKTIYPGRFVQTHAGQVVHTDIPFDIMVDVAPRILGSTAGAWEYLLRDSGAGESPGFDGIIKESQVMRRTVAIAAKAALAGVGVLLLGPTGSGKERFAQAIHAASGRTGALEAVNCAAFPGDLLESELFGHTRGAFTGAERDYEGRFAKAHNGTLFLDEIAEASPKMQAKLLRVLQPPDAANPTLLQFRRVGGNKDETTDVRVVAATNRDLLTAVQQGRFRADLYYRLAVVTVRIPPLSARRKDIPVLARHFLEQANKSLEATMSGYRMKHFSEETLAFLMKQPWPGNVRQLQHVVRVAAIYSPEETLRVEDMEEALHYSPGFPEPEAILNRPLGEGFRLNDVLDEVQRHYIQKARIESNGMKNRAAELLGFKSYQALDSRMKSLGLEWPSRRRGHAGR